MSLLGILIVLVVVGVILYVINKYVPMDAKIKTILNWVVIIFLIIYLLRAFGAFGYLREVNI